MPYPPAHHDDHYAILHSAIGPDDRKRVLKHDSTFAVLDRYGNIEPFGHNEFGVFHCDTRFLSKLALRLVWRHVPPTRLTLLSSAVRDDNALLTVHLTNADVDPGQPGGVRQGTLHLIRTQALRDGTLFDSLRVHNYGDAMVEFLLTLDHAADYADIFEVRGMAREKHGRIEPARIAERTVTYGYRGLDGRNRHTRITFDPPPATLQENQATYRMVLRPHGAVTLRWTVQCDLEETSPGTAPAQPAVKPAPTEHAGAVQALHDEFAAALATQPRLVTSNAQFNELVGRSRADLHVLTTHTRLGPYPCAGVPWFSTPFGRDGLITALQCLWLNPSFARGVLAFLAATQADRADEERDAQPGKILHEVRECEMAVTGEVPFGRYYGSVDATPLFVMLACAYFERTGDIAFLDSIWPHVERALRWIDESGDSDHDGFVEYARSSQRGLVNQGWKDSQDAVFHADGAQAEPPIALCEVQGYVYAAKLGAARIAKALQSEEQARVLQAQAESLRGRFEAAFWCDELSTYALALDGHKRPCRVVSSNAGHCLFTGIASRERAQRVAATLMSEPGFSGWGIRTVPSTVTRYNPMSYHNGSVWPHDNSIIAAGFARYGMQPLAGRVLNGMFDASLHVDLRRLPELFCGFTRSPGESPTLYPQACSPQAWAAGAPLLSLQACLGLEVDAPGHQLTLHKPFLPGFLERVCIEALRVGDATVDLEVARHAHDVGVRLTRRDGDLRVTVRM